MSDIISTGNKKDKWTLRVTELLNWLNDNKSAVLTAGDNISLTPKSDGTIEISASGGGEGTVTDVLVDGVSVVNQDGEAEIDLSDKQDKIVAGTNIQIGQDGKTISATDTTYSDFEGATSQQAGTHGLVPAPLVTEKDKFLKGDGTWDEAGGGNVDDVVMNGQSIVDANKVASFNNYVELTQAQYDALPDSKYSDGILYCIKDTGIVEGDKYAPVIYSLEEREVGVYTNGKPIYQKTYVLNGQAAGNIDTIIDITSDYAIFDEVVNIQAIAKNNYGEPIPLPFVHSNQQLDCGITVVTNGIRITVGRYFSYLSDVKVTLQYTKTTDIPGSGTWGTDGVPMVHYDGNEKVIGTWFGETLYEKSYYVASPVAGSTTTISDANMANVKYVVNAFGKYQRNVYSGSTVIYTVFDSLDMYESSSYNSFLRVIKLSPTSSEIGVTYKINGQNSSDLSNLLITIQYTKTS